MNVFSLFMIAVTLTGCGKLKEAAKNASSAFNPQIPNQFAAPDLIAAGPYTPGSYFKVLRDVDAAKDIRVIELQYMSDKTFILTVTHFAGGNLSGPVYFQKKSGVYTETNGKLAHTPTYDTCNDLTPQYIDVSGDKKNIVNISFKGQTIGFYSYLKWMLPADIGSSIINSTEDAGCKVFKSQF